VALLNQVHAERLDRRRLTHTRHAGDADTQGLMSPLRLGVMHQRQHQLFGLLAVIGPGRFDQGDGPWERRAVTAFHCGGQVLDVIHLAAG
jgi:hypothetical protein